MQRLTDYRFCKNLEVGLNRDQHHNPENSGIPCTGDDCGCVLSFGACDLLCRIPSTLSAFVDPLDLNNSTHHRSSFCEALSAVAKCVMQEPMWTCAVRLDTSRCIRDSYHRLANTSNAVSHNGTGLRRAGHTSLLK